MVINYHLFTQNSDVYCLKLILDRLSPEEETSLCYMYFYVLWALTAIVFNAIGGHVYTEKKWFNTVRCLNYATKNRAYLLRELLGYLGDYYDPLLDSRPNALVNAIVHRSEECVKMLFEHIDSKDIKDKLIATKDIKRNALISCVKQKNAA